ncbi:hypothetical protein SI65_04689 [Aspergillus cristatus]|uniref:Kazal-like domain-containing protein n=1 Tax=Aspergillus cristatus TaxID=573508 RepID=A0A1E3BFG6_ASPCR|nr:hypothetical protein SI65_04689 [Aspergillus cristatus]
MQLILAALLLPLSLALPVPSSEEAPAAEESIISPNSCPGVCANLSSPVCGKIEDGVYTIFDNACFLRKANCDGLSFIGVPLETCFETQVTEDDNYVPEEDEHDSDEDNDDALETADHPHRPPKGHPGRKKGHRKGNKKDNSKGKKKGKKIFGKI